MVAFRKVWRRLRCYLSGEPQPWDTVTVLDPPETCESGTIYLVGERPNVWAAIMPCPCGCGEQIQLSLLKKSRPRWRVKEHVDGSVSFHPSIWRREGCGSHFFVHHGVVKWCRPGSAGRWLEP